MERDSPIVCKYIPDSKFLIYHYQDYNLSEKATFYHCTTDRFNDEIKACGDLLGHTGPIPVAVYSKLTY